MHQTNFKHDMPTRIDRAIKKKQDAESAWRAVCKVVDARDKRICRCCGKKTNPDDVGLLRGHRHHITYRSAGGKDVSSNLVTLCPVCHNDEHKSRLEIHGDADVALAFYRLDEDEHWYLSRRELSVGRFERD